MYVCMYVCMYNICIYSLYNLLLSSFSVRAFPRLQGSHVAAMRKLLRIFRGSKSLGQSLISQGTEWNWIHADLRSKSSSLLICLGEDFSNLLATTGQMGNFANQWLHVVTDADKDQGVFAGFCLWLKKMQSGKVDDDPPQLHPALQSWLQSQKDSNFMRDRSGRDKLCWFRLPTWFFFPLFFPSFVLPWTCGHPVAMLAFAV